MLMLQVLVVVVSSLVYIILGGLTHEILKLKKDSLPNERYELREFIRDFGSLVSCVWPAVLLIWGLFLLAGLGGSIVRNVVARRAGPKLPRAIATGRRVPDDIRSKR